MGTKKRTAELIFDLQWNTKPEGDKYGLIGIYDMPAITSNFEKFKSYLLKNSGMVGDDVKVTFVTGPSSGWVIDSQAAFEIALCAFRLKSKLGEVISLKLDRKSASLGAIKKPSNDAHTQIDNGEMQAMPPVAPDWFMSYMGQFKRDVVDEVTFAVTANLHPKPLRDPIGNHVAKRYGYGHTWTKRSRHVADEYIERDLQRAFKMDRKLDTKLEKLDAKTKKMKDKKMALLHKIESTVEQSEVKPATGVCTTDMNATLVSDHVDVPRLIGGDVYLHEWKVKNNGTLPWTEKTVLRLTWGSALMTPAKNVLACPPLQPGECGVINVRFQIPMQAGTYESYWNFFEEQTRFGQWLSCVVTVEPISYLFDKSERKRSNCFVLGPQSTSPNLSHNLSNLTIDDDKKVMAGFGSDFKFEPESFSNVETEANTSNRYGIAEEDLILDLSQLPNKKTGGEVQSEIKILNSDLSHDNNNNNDASANNNSSSESICEVASEASSDLDSGYDVLVAPIYREKEESGYVYIEIDGDKLAVPKHIMSAKFLATAENAPPPPVEEVKPEAPLQPETPKAAANEIVNLEAQLLDLEQNAKSLLSHCSTTGTCFSEANQTDSRLFIFPRNNPGYEVVEPCPIKEEVVCPTNQVEVMPTDPSQTYTWAQSQTQYTLADLVKAQNASHLTCDPYGSGHSRSASVHSGNFQAVPNFQQQVKPEASAPPTVEHPITPPKSASGATPPTTPPQPSLGSPNVHILPENLVSGAVNVASSAINTARSVINMIVPPKQEAGRWVEGHWIHERPDTKRAKNMRLLNEMGFWDTDLNVTLLVRHKDDVNKVISDLIQ